MFSVSQYLPFFMCLAIKKLNPTYIHVGKFRLIRYDMVAVLKTCIV